MSLVDWLANHGEANEAIDLLGVRVDGGGPAVAERLANLLAAAA